MEKGVRQPDTFLACLKVFWSRLRIAGRFRGAIRSLRRKNLGLLKEVAAISPVQGMAECAIIPQVLADSGTLLSCVDNGVIQLWRVIVGGNSGRIRMDATQSCVGQKVRENLRRE